MKRIFALVLPILLLTSKAYADACATDLMPLFTGPQAAAICSSFSAGTIGTLANNTYATARNAADSANINVWKVDATDDTVLNADTGDVIKLSVAGTSEVTVDNDALTFTGASASLGFGATSGLFKVNGNTELTLTDDALTFAGASASLAFGATSGLFKVNGNTELTLTDDQLALAGATFDFVPGATAIRFRDTADAQTNLNITDAGVVTARAGLIATAGGVTATAGNVALTAGDLTFGGTSQKIVAPTTSLLVRDHADANTNITVTDAGAVTTRAGITATSGGLTATAGNIAATNGNLTFGTSGNGLVWKGAGIAAAGNSQGTATAIVATENEVISADGTKGVILPASVEGKQFIIINTANAVLKVYPATGQQINALGANNAGNIPALDTGVCIGSIGSGGWYCSTRPDMA